MQDHMDKLPDDEKFDIDADDGNFLIRYREWRDIFSTLFINNDFADNWTGVRFNSSWTKFACGGIPHRATVPEFEKFANNPQFLIQPTKDSEIMLSLQQPGGRLPEIRDSRDRKKYYEYPFAETLNYATVLIFRLPSNYNKRYIEKFEKKDLVYVSPIKRERENTGRVSLKEGETYIVVPATEKPGKLGEFFLSIYVNQSMRDVEIKRVFHPNDMNSGKEEVLPVFIPEEAEKVCNRATSWKIQLVKESLKYVITDNERDAYESDD
jgi:hypothetical protein